LTRKQQVASRVECVDGDFPEGSRAVERVHRQVVADHGAFEAQLAPQERLQDGLRQRGRVIGIERGIADVRRHQHR